MLLTSHLVPNADAARFELLRERLNATHPVGPDYLLIDGTPKTVVNLDNLHLKNVIFRNTTIRYTGAPLRLENVSFVNCTFDVQYTPNAIALADSLLKNSAVEFSAT